MICEPYSRTVGIVCITFYAIVRALFYIKSDQEMIRIPKSNLLIFLKTDIVLFSDVIRMIRLQCSKVKHNMSDGEIVSKDNLVKFFFLLIEAIICICRRHSEKLREIFSLNVVSYTQGPHHSLANNTN